MKRGENLIELAARSSSLQRHSELFASKTKHVRNKFWWQNIKLAVWIGIVGAVLAIVVVLAVLGGVGVFNSDRH
jgi:hypothetical protein